MSQMVHKVTLSTGKVVLLRDPKIKHQNLAMQAVAKRAGDNSMLMATMMQQEMLKMLLVQVDGQAVDNKAAEDLDGLFTYSEYIQLSQVIGKLAGGEGLGELKTELVSIGKE